MLNGLPLRGGQQGGGRHPGEVAVGSGRRRHALEGVEQVDLAAGAALEQCQGRGHHAAPPPDTALDNVAFDPVPADMPHRIP